MSVRRHVVRLVTTSAVLGGLVAVGAAPAFADDDSVRVRSSDGFSAGGSPGAVTVEVRKRSEGCAQVRTVLGLRLDGLRADQVRVQADAGGRWGPVGVSGGDGAVGTATVVPARPVVCEGRSARVRYRISFTAGAPAGRLTVVAQVVTAQGRSIGQDATTSRVGGRLAAVATPSPTPSKSKKPSPTPSPSAVATTEAAAPPAAPAAAPALATVAAGSGSLAAAPSSGMSPVLLFGVAMVVLGLGLIILLVRRSRADRRSTEPAEETSVGPAFPLPGKPGGTTYGAGAPVPPGGSPPAAGGVYGRQQPSQPTPSGGTVYGAPTPRPAGNVYGAPPAPATGPAPSTPPSAATPSSAATPPSASGAPPPYQAGLPKAGLYPPVVPRQPTGEAGSTGTPPAGPAAGGDSTTIMPRLPD
ncbi:hypothetical protein ACN28G_02170 [Micromonospora sp. WMMA1923]|uniref:hypothetical protein n=1 Tax=Micromonospora sp. WMMA1923 TaxID=3404125 RepID=UPI003B960669